MAWFGFGMEGESVVVKRWIQINHAAAKLAPLGQVVESIYIVHIADACKVLFPRFVMERGVQERLEGLSSVL
jgi:hypothetical protein